MNGTDRAEGIDLHLAAGSDGIDAVPDGAASPQPATDIDGDPRPQGPALDVGADERVP